MKNKEYKILSLLICAVVLLMLSGCNSSEGNKASTEGTDTAFVTEGKEEVAASSLEEATANSATETQAVAETETTAETEAEPTTSNQEKESVDNGNGIVLPDDNW